MRAQGIKHYSCAGGFPAAACVMEYHKKAVALASSIFSRVGHRVGHSGNSSWQAAAQGRVFRFEPFIMA